MKITNWPPTLKTALFQTLIRHIPPKVSSLHLEDIVNELIDALSKGEIQITLENSSKPNELKADGWPSAHYQAIIESGWVDGNSSPILLKGNQLSWRRWSVEMNEVIEELLIKNKSQNKLLPTSNLPNPKKNTYIQKLNLEQQTAVDRIATQNLLLISGGPGTGKTSTIARILEHALQLNPFLQIGLAAPTGKATRRLQDSLHQSFEEIKRPQNEIISKIPSRTLHSWLGARAGRFERDAKNPLPLDLLVIDEMSMVDLGLMKALLKALPKKTQLILVGDPNQLPPVGSGAIWHKLQEKNILKDFAESAIHLRQVYRNNGAIAETSKILREKDINSFWAHIRTLPKSANIKKYHFQQDLIPSLVLKSLQIHQKQLNDISDALSKDISQEIESSNISLQKHEIAVNKLLSIIDNLMVLCPKKHGLWGVNHIHQQLLGTNFEHDAVNWPPGTPIMCLENQPELGLSNGDIGVVIGKENHCRLLFRISDYEDRVASTKLIHPTRLKSFQPAFAMTIHKAQGSEANTVILLWPEQSYNFTSNNDLAHKRNNYDSKLLYTGITRARHKLELFLVEEYKGEKKTS